MTIPTLAAVLIVKNEALQLEACLQSVQGWVDEIIIVDSGSTDNTESIARSFNAKFIVNTDWQGFGQQRQWAQQHCNADWLFWIDADEVVTPELQKSIVKVVRANTPHTVYRINRLSWVFGRFIRHSGWYPDRVVRLYPRALTQYNDALVHEHVIVPAKAVVKELRGDLLHYTYRSVEHYLVKSAHYARAWADKQTQQGRKASLLQGVAHAVGCFIKMYIIRQGFRDGRSGFLLAILSAHSAFVKYADLWARRQPEPPQKNRL
jgi:(heptosyl)LPS beta-1,4-glucosyltransferase